MTYSLWRGKECLGEVVAKFPADRAVVYGLFTPTTAFTDIGSLMQTRLPVTGQPVLVSRFDTSTGPGPTNLRPMTREEAAGLPREAQFVLRDGSAEVVDVDMIALSPESIPAIAGPFADLCRSHGCHDVAWLLSAHRNQEGSTA